MKISLFYFAAHSKSTDHNSKYDLVVEGAKFADKNDFHAVWIPERHFHPFGGLYPNPSVLCSALSMVTRRIRLRAGSVVLPFHNPIRVAEEWAVVDNLSNGRVDIAFARGWNPRDFIMAPERFNENKDNFFSDVQDVLSLWRGETFKRKQGNGEIGSFEIYPSPVQKNLNYWITCSGNPEMFEQAGKIGANVLTALISQNLSDLKSNLTVYRKALSTNGFNPDDKTVTLMLHTFVGEEMQQAKSVCKVPMINYFKTSTDLRNFKVSGVSQLTPHQQEKLYDLSFEKFVQTNALIGDVDHCNTTIEKFAALGVNEIACLIDFGVTFEHAMKGLENLAVLKKETVEN